MVAPVDHVILSDCHITHVLRLDLIHPVTGGNKIFKLKYNLETAARRNVPVLTFGGKHSNHLAATAVTCAQAGIRATAVVAGHEAELTPTIGLARKAGTQILFVTSAVYRQGVESETVRELLERQPMHVIPPGGFNEEGVKGCMEILPENADYDYILVACGTGATFAGLLAGLKNKTVLVGISPLKGKNTLPDQVNAFLGNKIPDGPVAGDEVLRDRVISRHCILSAFAGKGFARFEPGLYALRETFQAQTGISLDHVYVPKVLRACGALFRSGHIPPGKKVLIVHTGGLQGNLAFERRYGSGTDIPVQQADLGAAG